MRLKANEHGGYTACCSLCKAEIKSLTVVSMLLDMAHVLCNPCFIDLYSLKQQLKELK